MLRSTRPPETATLEQPPWGEAVLGAILANPHINIFLVDVHEDGSFGYSLLDWASQARPGTATRLSSPTELFGPGDAAAVTARYRACIVADRPLVYEERLVGRQGPRWWQTSLTPIRDEDGCIVRLLGVAIDITEKKLVEDRLHDAERQLASIAHNLPGVVFRRVLRPDGGVAYPYFDSRLKALTGHDAEAAMRDPSLMTRLISPTDRPRFDAAIRRSAAALSPLDLELRLVDAGGRETWVRFIAQTAREADGTVVWDGVVLDIGDRKRAEAAAETASARLLGAVEALSEAVAVFDAEDRLVLCNARFREVHDAIAEHLVPGAKFADVLRAAVLAGIFPEASGDPETWIGDRMSYHRRGEASFERRLEDGRWLQVREQRTPDGGLAIVATDITDLKRREETLRILASAGRGESELYEAVARALHVALDSRWTGVCRVTGDRERAEILAWVERGERRDPYVYPLAGTPCGELLAQGSFLAIPDNLVARYPEDVDLASFGAESYIGAVIRDLAGQPIGHLFGIDDKPSPDFALRRELIELIAARVGFEMQRLAAEHALRRAKESAELASRAKTEFLANMSHELRTPLNAIIGFAQMIAGEILGPAGRPEYAEYARDIHASSRHLLDIINDILDVAKIEAGMLAPNLAPVDVEATALACARLVRSKAEDAGIALTTTVAGELPAIEADERMLKQILLNLLSNAVKFTPSGGSVMLRAAAGDDGGVVCTISDTGIGIDEQDFETVFRPFGQVDSSLSRRFPGTGLGLPLTKGLVELHGGSLALTSRPGEGTEVTVTLPRRPPSSG